MTVQNYCMVNAATNICENVCLWDGNPNTWTPPPGYILLVQATTPAKDWSWNDTDKVWTLEVQMGDGQIGYTWDGTYLTTSEPMPPTPPAEQPTVSGAQTL